MYMVSMITNFFSVRGFGQGVFLKPHFGHPVMKILAKTLGTSNQKLELLVAGASDLSARVQKLIARKLRAHDILIATHAPDACVA